MQNQQSQYKPISSHINQIQQIITQKGTNMDLLNQQFKVILQVSIHQLNEAFGLTQALRKLNPNIQIYTLYDSMKNPCCVDIVGAKHIDYHLLFHFGNACFSQPLNPKHYYIFNSLNNQREALIKQKIIQSIQKIQKLGSVMCIVDQSVYMLIGELKKDIRLQNVRWCKFGFQCQGQQFQYMGYGYYGDKKWERKDVLIISQNQDSELVQNIVFTKVNMGINNLHLISCDKPIYSVQLDSNKKVMQRMSLISKIKDYQTFGICVSNPSTEYCQQAMKSCENLLKQNHKKYFFFMMNNLNEAKLGNFPEIEIYIIISCFNYSLYSSKHFHRIVITPLDLEIAFQIKPIHQYCFDLKSWLVYKILKQQQKSYQQKKQQEKQHQEKKLQNQNQIQKIKNQTMLYKSIQTLDYYRNKQYKGLDFTEKVQVKKVRKGKVGVASQYKQIQE